MDVKQIYTLTNDAVAEATGDSALLKEDLSNLVDVGTSLFNANAVDSYVKALVNRIGKVFFTDRSYKGNLVSIMMDAWEYGSVLQRIRVEIPQAQENESWNLVNGQSYDNQIFYQPNVDATFYNKKETYEIPVSITELQVKQSFASADELRAFIAMIYTSVDNGLTIRNDEMARRAINNMIATTIEDDIGGSLGTSGVRAINLLKLYNDQFSESLAAADCLYDANFIRYASYIIGLHSDRLTTPSKLFNIAGKVRFTPKEDQKIVYLADFARAAGVYLYDGVGQFKEEKIKLPMGETVPYWQGTGTGYDFSDITDVKVTTADGDDVEVTGILGCIFDKYAVALANLNKRTTTFYNPKAEFFNNYYKCDASYLNDKAENFIVFFAHA